MAGPGADLDEGVQVGGGESARLLPACGEHAVEPLGVLRVLGGVGRRQGGDRGVQGGVRGGGERVGGDAGHVAEAVRFEEEGAEEGLLDVEHRLGRWDGVEVVFVGFGGVGHQAARVKSSGSRVTPRCGARRWPASSGGTALPIWENCWPLLPAQG